MADAKKIEEKKAYAGEKKPSMKRRSDINNYHGKHVYMLTLAVEGQGEQAVMRAVLDERLPLIFLTPWGFNKFSKPGHQYFEACAEGRFLILAPWEHQNEHIPLTRAMCKALNSMTEQICKL